MDSNHQYIYDTNSDDTTESESSECSEEEGYEKEFKINQGMMYMTSCNINQDIIPLTIHGDNMTLNTSNSYYVGSEEHPGTIILNGIYDVYCDFFSYTQTTGVVNINNIGNIIVLNIDELNSSSFNVDISSNIIQCPSKILIPILSISNGRNILNTDTLYITSILPKKICKLTITMSILKVGNISEDEIDNGKFILKLIFKKNSTSNLNMLNNSKSKIHF